MATSPEQRHHAVSWRTVLIHEAEHVVPVRVLTPPRPSGWLVWAHGGSWSRGSAEHWHEPCADLAARSSCVVVSVDYRLAPRHRYPAPVEDVLTAMGWARQHMARDGDDPDLLSVGGDSAGGTLAAEAALTWRDRGRSLAAQVLAYPPLDPACTAASYAPDGRFPDRATMRAAWTAHLGSDGDPGRAAPYGALLDAGMLQGVAPTILAVGDLDPVRDDVVAHAGRLRRAGVPVTCRTFADTRHGAFLAAGTNARTDVHRRPEPTMREWLALTLRSHLDRHSAQPHHLGEDHDAD
jgi:acetyl esterase